MGFFSFVQGIAMDLGTANTIIIHNDKIVVDEPSVVALDSRGKLVAVGEEHFVGGREEILVLFGQRDFFVGEVLFDELLGLGGQLGDGDGPIVVGANGGLQGEDGYEQNEKLFHGVIVF